MQPSRHDRNETPFDHLLSDHPRAAEASRIIQQLDDAGFVAYLAGGCVRDALLGRTPKDFDVATNATPDSVREVFGRRNTLAFGASFGVIGVLPEKKHRAVGGATEPTEVATFRSDGTYSDGRRPDSVHYGKAEEDAKRRDFTINGLFYDPVGDEVIDYVGGEEDLHDGILRAIGDPWQRFDEDKLRMLRAVRMVTTLNFAIEPATLAAIREHADCISVVSGERIGAEMRRILNSPNAAKGLELLHQTMLGDTVLPEFANIFRPPLESHLFALRRRDFPSSLACALIATDLNDEPLSAICHRWKLSNEEHRQIAAAIKHWRIYVQSDSLPWSTVQPCLIHRDAEVILNVATAAARAQHLHEGGIERIREAFQWPREKLDPPPLLTGDDLIESGIPAGPRFRAILQTIRDKQLDGEIETREQAFEIARAS